MNIKPAFFLALALVAFVLIWSFSQPAHARLRPGRTAPPPTNPVPADPPTGGGSPTLVCTLYPASCVQ